MGNSVRKAAGWGHADRTMIGVVDQQISAVSEHKKRLDLSLLSWRVP
jgi:hypothetical protein